MNKNIEEIKKELISNGYRPILIFKPECLRDYISSFEPTIEELIEIHDTLFSEEVRGELARLDNDVEIGIVIQEDRVLWSVLANTNKFYSPGYVGCKTIMEFVECSYTHHVINWQDFDCLSEKDTIWDLFVMSADHLDPDIYPGYTYSFQCAILNDSCYFNASLFYSRIEHPYPTGKRFSGLLAHLYYSNFIDLYNNLFDVLLETIRKHFDVTMPLPLFLYNFCLENDKEKADSVKLIIDEFKNANPDYNWNKELKDCYAYSIAERCVVGNPNLKIKEIKD